jgi:uncharacterized protein with HEPN domain
MSPEEKDPAYLWDMIEASQSIQEILINKTYNDFVNDKIVKLAIERLIEIIGEAARKISKTFKENHQEIPWKSIIAQRNVLAHEYGDIRYERLWRVATVNIPELIQQLKPLIPEDPKSN